MGKRDEGGNENGSEPALNVVLIGAEAPGIRTLRSLEQSDVRIVAVMASPRRHESLRASLWGLAAKLGYTTWLAELVRDPKFAVQVRDAGVDVILNAYSLFLIRNEVLEAPRLGSFNLHPGPLPRYAGLNSVCWAIYRGEKEHGVTLHKMVPAIDAGPIVYQEFIGIGDEETGLSLTVKCVNIGISLIMRLLQAAAQRPSNIPLLPQDFSKREYFGREVPQNGNLFWNSSAQRIVNFVRASDFFPFITLGYSPHQTWEFESGNFQSPLDWNAGRRATGHNWQRAKWRSRGRVRRRMDPGAAGVPKRKTHSGAGSAHGRGPVSSLQQHIRIMNSQIDDFEAPIIKPILIGDQVIGSDGGAINPVRGETMGLD